MSVYGLTEVTKLWMLVGGLVVLMLLLAWLIVVD
jgi:hypothetical protein